MSITCHRLHSVGYTTLFIRLRLLRSIDYMTPDARTRYHVGGYTALFIRLRLLRSIDYMTPDARTRYTLVVTQHPLHDVGFIVPLIGRRLHGARHMASDTRRR